MVDYYELTGFHCDATPDRRLRHSASPTARATRDAVRIAREVAASRSDRGREAPRVIPIAIKPARKPYSTI